MTALERITTESNLGIYGDAQTAEELAGRGLNLMRDAFTTLDEAYRTVKRLRKEGALRQNRAQGGETVQVGTTGRLDVLEAQTGAQHEGEQ